MGFLLLFFLVELILLLSLFRIEPQQSHAFEGQSDLVAFQDLLQQLKRARLENRLDSKLKHINRYKLLIIDELGYLPIDKDDSNLFFQLIDMRYEKKSTILATNINFNDWDSIFKDAVVANAILDRVLHHAKVITINGRSYRVKDYIKSSE